MSRKEYRWWRDLAEALEESAACRLQESLVPFLVSDLTGKEAGVLLVLESPFREEVEAGVPLAGASGREVSRLVEEKVLDRTLPGLPFGILRERGEPSVESVGLINVCRLPLQAAVYPETIHRTFPRLVQGFETLHRSPEAQSRREAATDRLERAILDDLDRRLGDAGPEDTPLVACGKMAQAYLGKCAPERFRLEVPHPAQGQWHRSENRETLERLAELLRQALG